MTETLALAKLALVEDSSLCGDKRPLKLSVSLASILRSSTPPIFFIALNRTPEKYYDLSTQSE